MKLPTALVALLTLGGTMSLLSGATGEEAEPARIAAFPGAEGYTNVEEYLNGTDPTVFVDYTKPENNINSLEKSHAK